MQSNERSSVQFRIQTSSLHCCPLWAISRSRKMTTCLCNYTSATNDATGTPMLTVVAEVVRQCLDSRIEANRREVDSCYTKACAQH